MLQSILSHVRNVAFGISDIITIPLTVSLSKVLCTSGVVVAIGTAVGMTYKYLQDRRAPPGPPSLPILGNVLQVPRRFQSIPFMDWCYQYGASLKLLSTSNALERKLSRPDLLA